MTKASTKPKGKGTARATAADSSRTTRPKHAILDTNRKTEICRNWLKGCCTYGDGCAFAHGNSELKYRTLREMENAGRIHDATKYRCFPCMTWVATGSCPYGTRCVFIHDPRVEGPEHACLHGSCQARSGITATCQTGDAIFFFPDIVRDIDSTEVPTHLARYDLDAHMGSVFSYRVVHDLWYSFVSAFEDAPPVIGYTEDDNDLTLAVQRNRNSNPGGSCGGSGSGSPSVTSTCTSSSSFWTSASTTDAGRRGSPASPSSIIASDSLLVSSHKSPGFISRTPTYAASPAAAAFEANAAGAASGGAFGARCRVALPSASMQPTTLPSDTEERPEFSSDDVKHLPVFEGLSRGFSACPPTRSCPMDCLIGSGNGHAVPLQVGPAPPATSAPVTSSPMWSLWAFPPLQSAAADILADDDYNTSSSSASYVSDSSYASDNSYFSSFESCTSPLLDNAGALEVVSMAQRPDCPLPNPTRLVSPAAGWITDQVEKGNSFFSFTHSFSSRINDSNNDGNDNNIPGRQEQHRQLGQRCDYISQPSCPSTDGSLYFYPAISSISGSSGTSGASQASSQVWGDSDSDSNNGTPTMSAASPWNFASLYHQQHPSFDIVSNSDTKLLPSSRMTAVGCDGTISGHGGNGYYSRSGYSAMHHHYHNNLHQETFNTREFRMAQNAQDWCC